MGIRGSLLRLVRSPEVLGHEDGETGVVEDPREEVEEPGEGLAVVVGLIERVELEVGVVEEGEAVGVQAAW